RVARRENLAQEERRPPREPRSVNGWSPVQRHAVGSWHHAREDADMAEHADGNELPIAIVEAEDPRRLTDDRHWPVHAPHVDRADTVELTDAGGAPEDPAKT